MKNVKITCNSRKLYRAGTQRVKTVMFDINLSRKILTVKMTEMVIWNITYSWLACHYYCP